MDISGIAQVFGAGLGAYFGRQMMPGQQPISTIIGAIVGNRMGYAGMKMVGMSDEKKDMYQMLMDSIGDSDTLKMALMSAGIYYFDSQMTTLPQVMSYVGAIDFGADYLSKSMAKMKNGPQPNE